jgi:hypothetical protein
MKATITDDFHFLSRSNDGQMATHAPRSILKIEVSAVGWISSSTTTAIVKGKLVVRKCIRAFEEEAGSTN